QDGNEIERAQHVRARGTTRAAMHPRLATRQPPGERGHCAAEDRPQHTKRSADEQRPVRCDQDPSRCPLYPWGEAGRMLLVSPALLREILDMMRAVLFSAVVVNSLDLFATAVGIHWFGNREGNPLLAPVVQQSWLGFVLLK